MEAVKINIKIEVASWLKDDFDYNGLGNLVLNETTSTGTSLIEMLRLVANKYPKFSKKAFNTQKQHLFDYCLVILNGTIMSAPDQLNTELKEGDTLTITPAFYGG